MTHPFGDRKRPAYLEQKITVPKNSGMYLLVYMAAHENGDWQFRAVVNGEVVEEFVVDKQGQRWKRARIDLSAWQGKTVTVRLENKANGWSWEFGYWDRIEVKGL